jgi:hypothetical protein
MRTACPIVLALLIACAAAPPPAADSGPDLWTGTYRYNGTRTRLEREGKFYRFSDARLAQFRFRLVPGDWLEDDTMREPVRVYPVAPVRLEGRRLPAVKAVAIH